jgi:hypothetical protein
MRFRKIFLQVFSLLLMITGASAQVRTISYDFNRNTFDGDYDLPANSRFNIIGTVDSSIGLVELDIYKGYNKHQEKNLFYTTSWLRSPLDRDGRFFLSVKFSLRSGQKYDFNIRFYKPINEEQRNYTQKMLLTSVQSYLMASARTDKRGLSLSASPEQMRKDLNIIVRDGLIKYRSRSGESFPGFSDILVRQLEAFSSITGGRARDIERDEDRTLSDVFNRIIEAILLQAGIETEQYLNSDMLILSDSRILTDYPVENTHNELAIHVGYGGAWFNGGFDQFNYGHRPYAGVSFPLGNKAHSKKFWSNTSVSTGVFFLNFKDNDGNTLKGPIIQRPFYLGLGYKVFSFIRLNAGAVLLEEKQQNGGFINADKIKIRPFVGISAELKFWADFAK